VFPAPTNGNGFPPSTITLNLTCPKLEKGSNLPQEAIGQPGSNVAGLAPAPTITMTPTAISDVHPGVNPAANPGNSNVVGQTLPPVTVSKSFNPATIPADGSTQSVLTFTLTNPAGNPAQLNLKFTDTLPANLTLIGPIGNTCSVVNTLLTLPGTVTMQGGMFGGLSSCIVRFGVISSTPGVYTNSSGNISNVSGNLDFSGVNATLTVTGPQQVKPNPGTVNLSGPATQAPPPPPISSVDFGGLPTTCKTSTYASVQGLPPYDNVGVSWSPVPGADNYMVAVIGMGVPSWPGHSKVLASQNFAAPPATFNLVSTPQGIQDIHDLLNAHGTFVIIVQAQNSKARFDGICNITHIIRAVPRLPTSTPIPPTQPPASGPSCVMHNVCKTDPLNGGQICHTVCS
jgi:hypothetical protein